MSGSRNVEDFNYQTYGYICLTRIWIIINTWNLFNRANSFLSYSRQRNCQCDQTPILASRPRSRRICLAVGMYRTLIIKHMVTYAWPEFETSLTHEINLIVLILFYHIQGNVTLRVTFTPILASRPRSRRVCSGVRL